jgi:hypothetical protein
MNRKLVSVALIALVALLAGVAGTGAQDSPPKEAEGVQALASSAFTFQGHLDKGGAVTDTCDFQFKLYNASGGGSQVGATLNRNGVAVSDGKFTVKLDFGAGPFKGDARYLQIAVKCSGDAALVDLTGRVALTATPYAIGLVPGAAIEAGMGNTTVLYGGNSSSTGTGPGVMGVTKSTSYSAAGVLGRVKVTSPGGYSAGVRGINDGTGGLGIGVFGSQDGNGWGVYGTTPAGIGVYGLHEDATGTGPGVLGATNSASSEARGVVGRVNPSTAGGFSAGVRGINNSTSGNGIGVYGSQAGKGWGVYGVTPGGIGVYGLHESNAGTAPGVQGTTNSVASNASGVLGQVYSPAPGGYSAGVRGTNYGTAGYGIGVYGEQKGSGWGIYGKTTSGYAGYFSGNIYVTGSCTGCALAYIGLNAGDAPLETGDLVAVSGVSSPLQGAAMPVLNVRRADARSSSAVLGVVGSKAQSVGLQSDGEQEVDNVVPAEGPAAPGDYLFIVVQGLAQVKADAMGGAIRAGDALTAAGPVAGPTGPELQVGRAMENLEGASGLIWVMVDLQ